jgi:hypothetical protein
MGSVLRCGTNRSRSGNKGSVKKTPINGQAKHLLGLKKNIWKICENSLQSYPAVSRSACLLSQTMKGLGRGKD